jgi:hypothetical protein
MMWFTAAVPIVGAASIRIHSPPDSLWNGSVWSETATPEYVPGAA